MSYQQALLTPQVDSIARPALPSVCSLLVGPVLSFIHLLFNRSFHSLLLRGQSADGRISESGPATKRDSRDGVSSIPGSCPGSAVNKIYLDFEKMDNEGERKITCCMFDSLTGLSFGPRSVCRDDLRQIKSRPRLNFNLCLSLR